MGATRGWKKLLFTIILHHSASFSCEENRPDANNTELLSPAHAAAVALKQRISGAQLLAWERLERKRAASNSTALSIIQLGGSMAAGVDCVDDEFGVGKACSYSARFARSMAMVADAPINITYHNRAMGGTTTAGVLPQLELLLTGGTSLSRKASPDIILVDFSVNDRFEEQDWVDPKGSKAPGRGDDKTAVAEKEAKVFAASEALLRYVLERHPLSCVVIVEAFCENGSFSRRAHKRAALLYGVAFVAYSQLLANGCSALDI